MKNNRRDLLILKFLWEYKVATSAMIIERYFPNTKPRTAYNCLMRLKHKKLIITKVTSRGTFPVWELTKEGLKEIRNYIPKQNYCNKMYEIGCWLAISVNSSKHSVPPNFIKPLTIVVYA